MILPPFSLTIKAGKEEKSKQFPSFFSSFDSLWWNAPKFPSFFYLALLFTQLWLERKEWNQKSLSLSVGLEVRQENELSPHFSLGCSSFALSKLIPTGIHRILILCSVLCLSENNQFSCRLKWSFDITLFTC